MGAAAVDTSTLLEPEEGEPRPIPAMARRASESEVQEPGSGVHSAAFDSLMQHLYHAGDGDRLALPALLLRRRARAGRSIRGRTYTASGR